MSQICPKLLSVLKGESIVVFTVIETFLEKEDEQSKRLFSLYQVRQWLGALRCGFITHSLHKKSPARGTGVVSSNSHLVRGALCLSLVILRLS
jgi:hypothetical protein